MWSGLAQSKLSHGGGAVPVARFGRGQTEKGEDGLGGEMTSCRELGELPNLVATKACVGLDESDGEAVDHHLGVTRPCPVPDRVEGLDRPVHDNVPLVQAELRRLPVAELDKLRFPGGELPCDGDDFVASVDAHRLDAELVAGQHSFGDDSIFRIIQERPPFEPSDGVPCGTEIIVVTDQTHTRTAGARHGLDHDGGTCQ